MGTAGAAPGRAVGRSRLRSLERFFEVVDPIRWPADELE